tara:strand:+ start:9541 stop:9909 length:369 start_codon:yes stop_codon:yes gene_type:complete
MNEPTAYVNDVDLSLRSSEVPLASWTTGLTYGASNAPGIGVATANPGLAQSLPNWTLLDQDSAARTPQVSQIIGGGGYQGSEGKGTTAIDVVVNGGGNGSIVSSQEASLVTLSAGWVATTPP